MTLTPKGIICIYAHRNCIIYIWLLLKRIISGMNQKIIDNIHIQFKKKYIFLGKSPFQMKEKGQGYFK